MKTRIATIKLLITAAFCMLVMTSSAQDNKNIRKSYEWDDETKTETLTFNVPEKSNSLHFNFVGSISEGSLEITAWDPAGEKFRGFSLKSNGTDDDKSTIIISTKTGKRSNTVSVDKSDGVSSTSSSTSRSTSSSSSSSSGSSSSAIGDSGDNSYSYVSSSSNQSGAKGVMNKTITDPVAGNWKLEIKVKGVSGELSIIIDQD